MFQLDCRRSIELAGDGRRYGRRVAGRLDMPLDIRVEGRWTPSLKVCGLGTDQWEGSLLSYRFRYISRVDVLKSSTSACHHSRGTCREAPMHEKLGLVGS